ncbi:MAG: VOC family protein [Desulfobulbaceae bacterium]|nr:MAG: VOC family protein [Desulfobulbaceae bacterium]
MSCLVGAVDHFVLYVESIETASEFYRSLLGFTVVISDENRVSLHHTNGKINLHKAEKPFSPCARNPISGSADFCFIVTIPLEKLIERCHEIEVEIIEGPVARTGSSGPIESIYVRDPDGNLVELSRAMKR